MLDIVQEQLIPKYREFHSDLLYHQDDAFLFGPFAWGRFCEAILQQGPPWDEQDRIVAAALNQLNDYLGYRPIPILEGHKIEPYPHERLRPVPVYVREAGVAAGRYHDVVTCALQILRDSDQSLREASCFAPEVLEELAVDPRAYDFDHPVNKRPNYHFGQWDPHRIDNKGRYTRYIIQQVSLDALMARIDDRPAHPHDELVFEAAAVLAGTMLMAAGVSGSGPQTWDSSVTLASLVPRIAAYRDIFYEQLLHNMSGPHVERLRQESIELHQPFGGARQHLNAQLSHRRAMQLAHVHLAQVFARIGYLEAAKRQAAMVPVAAARIQCRIDCRLTAGQQALERGNMHEALDHLNLIRDLLRKGIECGAIVDPWNILGFDGNFSLFPAMENSVHDHRVDDLLGTMDRIFGLYARVWSESAAADETEICDRAGKEYEEVCQWWHQFAVHEVASVQSPPALELYHAARVVADALNRWHRGGATTGDVKFWSPYVDMFDSPKAYALAVEALLEKDDFVSSMSLLVHWLSKAPEVSLEGGNTSFHMLGRMWLNNLIARLLNNDEASPPFSLVRKFLDYLEANANEYWSVPQFRLASGGSTGSQRKPRMGDPRDTESAKHNDEDGEEEEEENHRTDGSDGLYSAAYEDVVYQDSTDDGVEGPVFDFDHSTEEELEAESERIVDRLAFLDTIARLWRTASVACVALVRKYDNLRNDLERVTAALDAWKTQARRMRNELSRLLEMLHEHPLVASGISHESMVQYDRRRLVKETLMEQIMATAVEMNDSLRFILGARRSIPGQESWDDTQDNAPEVSADIHVEDRQIAHLIAAAIQGNIEQARGDCSQLCQDWSNKKILYVPLAKGGSPIAIVEARVRQKALENQLIWLPRMGLFTEARELMDVARAMERNVPIGPGAVTQFDEV
ncbi:MAG: hypothetical protein KDA99_04500, partial [Planctomycetales bacterium]|nr:hypothetical protein [Planctomycetales bacterium]